MIVDEDAVYQTSSQYRFWSFSPAALKERRETINAAASQRVKLAIVAGQNGSDGNAKMPEVLTSDEETTLVRYYCLQTIKLSDHFEFPSNIKATAVQYMKRFYLANSPMDYHPKHILPAALFLATKTDNHYISLSRFSEQLPPGTSVKEPEFLLTQSLRFTFDVRHPFRGLQGGALRLLATSRLPDSSPQRMAFDSMLQTDDGVERPSNAEARVKEAHDAVKVILVTSALVSDVYFHFTPSQIWMAGLLIIDEPLADFYLRHLMGMEDDERERIGQILQRCKRMLLDNPDLVLLHDEKDPAYFKELRRIDRKCQKCMITEPKSNGQSEGERPQKRQKTEEL